MKINCFLLALALLTSFAVSAQTTYTLADTVVAKRYLEEAKVLITSAHYDAALGKLDTAGVILEGAVGKADLYFENVLHQKGRCSYFVGDYDRAIEYFQKTLGLRLKRLGSEHPDVGGSYNNLGAAYYSKSDYDRAIEYHLKALEIRLKALGPEHPDVALSYHNLGGAYYYKSDYDRAIEYHLKALEIRLKILGPEHPEVARSYNNLGGAYYSKGDNDRAIEYHLKALEIRLKILGPEHPEVARSYNNLGVAYHSKGDNDRAIEYHLKALEIRLKILDPEHPEVADSYDNLGLVYRSIGDYDQAIEGYQKALEIRSITLGAEHSDVAISYNNLGNAYGDKGDYDRKIEYHQKALKIRLKILSAEHSDVAISYNNLGNAYYFKGDYDRAIEYHQKALEIKLKILGPEHPEVASSYNNLGIVYSSKGNYGRAIEYHQKALEIKLKILGPEHPDVATSYNNLGNAYGNKGDYDREIEYHQKALEIRLIKLDAEHPDVADSFNGLGAAYGDKGDYARTIEYLQKALEIRIKKLGPEHPKVASSFNNLGYTYFSKNDYGRAIEYHQKALKIRLKKLGTEHPDVTDSYHSLGEVCKSKGNYTKSADYYIKALSSINSYRKTLENPSSKSTLAKESTGIYEGGISTNLLLYQLTDSLHYLHEAFHYAEQSKALSLYEAMKNTEALQISGIPDSLLQREYDLRVDIAYNEKRKQGEFEKGKEETDTTLLKISSKLFDLHRAYEQLIDTFETRYPDYYRLKYDFHTEDIASIQRDLLQPDQAMLEYFVGDSSIFIFLVIKDDYRVVEVKKDFPLEDWVQQLRYGIYGYRADSVKHDTLTAFAAEQYAEAAWQLYQKLLAPVDSLLPWRVVIIPDGILGYVPFEALLAEKPAQPQRFQNHAYFCRQHDLSYCYSATLLREMTEKRHKKEPERTLAAFAPFDTSGYQHWENLIGQVVPGTLTPDADPLSAANRKDFGPLPKSGEEAAVISKIWNGRYLLDADATEVRFNEMAADYRILHLATHGVADSRVGDYCYLAFAQIRDSIENELLYVREIYNLSLNADLVTLSACETGVGELQRGEGIISLARAFSYAGAKSIVTTLWSVDDAPTKDMMVAFYHNLNDGMTKDAALAEARRGFLKTPFAHPFYWAGFVGIGDMGEVGSGQ